MTIQTELKMNKIFKFMALASLAVVCSCQKEATEVAADSDVQDVTFTVELPGVLQTKAENLGNGKTATKLYYAIYKGGSNEEGAQVVRVEPKNTPAQPLTLNDLKAEVTFQLVKNYKYDIVFWAQAEGAPYKFDQDKATVTVTDAYTDADANDETRDAFFAMVDDYVVTSEKKSVPLYRPFAQINFCSDDYKNVSDLGLSMTSTIEVSEASVPSVLNLLTGVADTPVAVKFNATTVPAAAGETVEVTLDDKGTKKTYDNVAMNYILAGSQSANITALKGTFNYNNDKVVVDVPNVPYRRNYRTNIFGSLFTDNAVFQIEIKPVPYDHVDLNIKYPVESEGSEDSEGEDNSETI